VGTPGKIILKKSVDGDEQTVSIFNTDFIDEVLRLIDTKVSKVGPLDIVSTDGEKKIFGIDDNGEIWLNASGISSLRELLGCDSCTSAA